MQKKRVVSEARALHRARHAKEHEVRLVVADEQGQVTSGLTGLKPHATLILYRRHSLAAGAIPRPLINDDGVVCTLTRADIGRSGVVPAGTYDALELSHTTPRRVLVLALVALTLAVAYALFSWREPGARRGHYEGKTPEEIQEDLSADVAWYAMEISVASRISAPEGQTAIEARIENVEANHCDQRVRIFEKGAEEDVLFASGAIAPGEYLQWVELAHPLPVGTHTLVVEFQGYEQAVSLVSDEGAWLGHDTFGASCAAEVTLEVTARG